MRTVFADTAYWIALLNPEDEWADAAAQVTQQLGDAHIVTTQEVLAETLNFLSRGGRTLRREAAEAIREILTADNVTVVESSPDVFQTALERFESGAPGTLTDCVSLCTMDEEGLTEVLTNDKRFAQAGVSIVGREPPA